MGSEIYPKMEFNPPHPPTTISHLHENYVSMLFLTPQEIDFS